MTLTVRLKPDLEAALDVHCAERGVSKSLVVQEVLAEYLARLSGSSTARVAVATANAEPSAAFRAFEALGLVGAASGVGPAGKAGVRAAFDRWAGAKRRSWAATQTPGPAPSRRASAKRAAR
ncbi:MAG: ribbon-helix-helix domain-containing protein [Aquabacterium sp.]|nr:ribbon-helix-helix domain-containing protein [Aquabacterium sp.]